MSSRGPYRRHSTPFKLRLCQDIRSGIIGRRDAQRSHNIPANLIRLWLTQFDRVNDKGYVVELTTEPRVMTGRPTSGIYLEVWA